jgi:hypothetical protein
MINPWQLSYAASAPHAGAALDFGPPASGFTMTQMPAITAPEIVTDDSSVPRGDARRFGQDFLGGTTIAFELSVNGSTEDEDRALLGRLRAAWRADAVRSTPGAFATLKAHTGRYTYGRPRQLTADDRFAHVGRSDVIASFETADDLWYGPQESARVRFVAETVGGFVFPLVSPFTTTATSDRSQVFTVEGELPTWPIVDIAGPHSAVEVELLGVWRQRYPVTIPEGRVLRIDTRPWVRTARLNGSNVGAPTRDSSRMSEMSIPPGRHELALRGSSPTGTSSATVYWRPAYHVW